MVETNNLGDTVRQRRREKHLTQKDLAKLCNMSRDHICNIENGKVRPHLKTLLTLSKVLELDFSELVKIRKMLK